MSNKEAAKSFLKLAAAGHVQEAYDKHVASTFIHHNSHFAGDRQSLLTAMADASRQSPNKSLEIKQLFEEGETVIAHSLVTRGDPAAPGIAVIHILRFANGQIVELWDLAQPLAKDSPNENGMF